MRRLKHTKLTNTVAALSSAMLLLSCSAPHAAKKELPMPKQRPPIFRKRECSIEDGIITYKAKEDAREFFTALDMPEEYEDGRILATACSDERTLFLMSTKYGVYLGVALGGNNLEDGMNLVGLIGKRLVAHNMFLVDLTPIAREEPISILQNGIYAYILMQSGNVWRMDLSTSTGKKFEVASGGLWDTAAMMIYHGKIIVAQPGHDCIFVCTIDPETGDYSTVQYQSEKYVRGDVSFQLSDDGVNINVGENKFKFSESDGINIFPVE